jgi:hypothetical protein
MLFTPEAHEALADEPWSVERVRTAIAAIVADTQSAFDGGWPLHPLDADDDDDPAARLRTMYLGGAGVVAALHRLARRDFVALRRDYVPHLEVRWKPNQTFPTGTPSAAFGTARRESGWCYRGSPCRSISSGCRS